MRKYSYATATMIIVRLWLSANGQETFESYTDADEDRIKTFYNTRLEINPCCNVILGEPVEVTVWFRTDGTFNESDTLYIDLPRFTAGTPANEFGDGVNIDFDEVPYVEDGRQSVDNMEGCVARGGVRLCFALRNVRPYIDVEVWSVPGTRVGKPVGAQRFLRHEPVLPFAAENNNPAQGLECGNGALMKKLQDEELFVRISRGNGISVFCGWSENWSGFRIYTLSSEFDDVPLASSPLVGSGCRSDCYDRGMCDYCHETCLCYEGQGDKTTDIVDGGGWVRFDCAHYVCPAGKSWAARQKTLDGGGWAALDSHALAECSGNGSCNRTDASCMCAPGFEGDACQRNACPSYCSNHGVCLSMHELGQTAEAMPLMMESNIYGGVGSEELVAWDADAAYACVCDSSWEVGLGPGQNQQAEYFGADCSQRRCPSGEDPLTTVDETDCEGVMADGGFGVGQAGNLCHVDCSNRGQCDHNTGECDCYAGFFGDNCDKITALS